MSKKINKTATDDAIQTVLSAAQSFDKALETVEKQLEQTVHPFRKNALERFPVLFLLAVTFGAIMTEFGLDMVLVKYNILIDRPWIILAIGTGTLILTGVAYKKTK